MANTGDRMLQPESESSDVSDVITPSPSGENVPQIQGSTMPMSPSRSPQSVQQMVASVPSSPAQPVTSAELSPAVTPTQQRVNPWPSQGTPSAETGVVLGLEQLERQQDEAERRRRELSSAPPQQQSTSAHTSPVIVRRYAEDDDENTAPSSTLTRDAASHTGDGSLESSDDASAQHKESSKFGRMIKNTRRRLSSNEFMRRRDSDDPAEEDEAEAADALIYGHLQKLGRNGKWQTRWFETDGECLSYYKSSKRSKLLATLDLEKVGAIVVNEDDPKGCSFTIQVLGRPYYLRAESRAACKDWVITLNRVKEARLQQGNVKLVHQAKHILFKGPPDLLDRNVSNYTPGVVAVANRQRTRALDGSVMENMEGMMLSNGESEAGDVEVVTAAYYQNEDTDSLSQAVLARWQKRKSSMSRLASKLSRWARSLNKYKCTEGEDEGVRLDRHVHPPGHDNPSKIVSKKSVEVEALTTKSNPAVSGWIGKEASFAVKGGPGGLVSEDEDSAADATSLKAPVATTGSSVNCEEDDDGETRELS